MTVETLEQKFGTVRQSGLDLDKFLAYRKPSKRDRQNLVALHFPNLKHDCLLLLDQAAGNTFDHGHSDRCDWVKNRTFEILGKVIGEEL